LTAQGFRQRLQPWYQGLAGATAAGGDSYEKLCRRGIRRIHVLDDDRVRGSMLVYASRTHDRQLSCAFAGAAYAPHRLPVRTPAPPAAAAEHLDERRVSKPLAQPKCVAERTPPADPRAAGGMLSRRSTSRCSPP
jgi:hypothetical protein